MLSSSALRQSSRRVGASLLQRRGMAGGYPANMAVKKNKFIEEWNGKREITEKSFSVDFSGAPILVFYLMVIPFGIYTLTRSEFKNRGDRHYKDLV